MDKRERHVPVRQLDRADDYNSPGRLQSQSSESPTPSIRERLDEELKIMEAQMERFRLDRASARTVAKAHTNESEHSVLQETDRARQSFNHKQVASEPFLLFKHNQTNKSTTMSAEEQDKEAGSLGGDAINSLGGSNRATTTERRTTTTTTTKRTVKSSDDFVPAAGDIQQVRSESRTGSISSSTPIYGLAGTTTSTTTSTTSSTGTGPLPQQQPQQQQSSSTTSSSTHTTSSSSKQQQAANSAATSKTWTTSNTSGDGLQSPQVQDTEEGRVLKLRFDVTQYEPEEIVVKTVDNRLTVHAKHEERSENRSVYREYNREFHLPDGTDVEQIRSSLSKEGVLTVDCPLPSPQLHGASRRIPIEKV